LAWRPAAKIGHDVRSQELRMSIIQPSRTSSTGASRALPQSAEPGPDRPAKMPRLAWLEGIRIVAAVVLLLYHSQLLFTDYAYTPQAQGLIENWAQMAAAGHRLGSAWLAGPIWFGYQFVDVFVLISGFSLVLSLRGQPGSDFLKQRILRILLPFWTVAALAYPMLWGIGKVTHTYSPDAWHSFAGLTFPLLFEYGGKALLATNGPWWFVPLILSFAVIFPALWQLLQRWGGRNLLLVTLLVTWVYRALAVYLLGGHPTYVIAPSPADWQPFLPFIAKLNTFVIGMWTAQAYVQGRGPLFWPGRQALTVGLVTYGSGFVAQFYTPGWIVADGLVAIGLTLGCMVGFRALAQSAAASAWMTTLGRHSYSYFLIHNFVADRTVKLLVQDRLDWYYRSLPLMVVGTLALAILADRATPYLQQGFVSSWTWLDRRCTQPQVRC
jgi:peptidoglycan/LPS O-acetylase OafA/YrhL